VSKDREEVKVRKCNICTSRRILNFDISIISFYFLKRKRRSTGGGGGVCAPVVINIPLVHHWQSWGLGDAYHGTLKFCPLVVFEKYCCTNIRCSDGNIAPAD
jgi:hypothetical protein